MANVFDDVGNKIKGGPFVLWVCLLCMAMFVIGVAHFIEDTVSSRNGLALLEQTFLIKPVNINFVYWTLSLTPQIGQTVLSYMFFLDRKKNKWALALAIAFFLVDFISDVEDRSNQHFLPVGGGVNLDSTTLVASILTLMAFTVGSELFLSVSTGMFLTLFRDAIKQFGILYAGVIKEWADARVEINDALRRVDNSRPPKQSGQPQQQKGGGGMNNPVRQPQSNGNSGGGEPHQTPPGGHGQGNRQGNGQQYGQPSQRPQRPTALRMHPPTLRTHPPTQDEIDELFDGVFPGGH